MIGTFVALDLILFYLFFEAVLIPMFIIIGVWGGKNRVYASYKFFLGGYGFLRFSLTLFPNASLELAPLIFWMSVIAIIYTSLVAYRQNDIKKLIAYSSVAHMGFVTMGILRARLPFMAAL